MDLAERSEPELRAAGQREWLERLEVEHDNLRAALEWSLESDPTAGLRLSGSLWRFWQHRGYLAEGRHWCEAALARAPAVGSPQDQRVRAWALVGAGTMASMLGNHQAQRAFFEESQALFRVVEDRVGLALVLRTMGECLLYDGNSAQARALLEESWDLARASDDQRGAGMALGYLGLLAVREHDHPRARRLLAEAQEVLRQIGDTTMTSAWLGIEGWFGLGTGDLLEARRSFELALELIRPLGSKMFVAFAVLGLGCLEQVEGDRSRARELLGESAQLLRDIQTRGLLRQALGYMGYVAAQRARYAQGVRLLAFAIAGPPAYNELSVVLPSAQQAERDVALAAARAALGEDAFAAAWAEGKAMTLDQAIAAALEEEKG